MRKGFRVEGFDSGVRPKPLSATNSKPESLPEVLFLEATIFRAFACQEMIFNRSDGEVAARLIRLFVSQLEMAPRPPVV